MSEEQRRRNEPTKHEKQRSAALVMAEFHHEKDDDVVAARTKVDEITESLNELSRAHRQTQQEFAVARKRLGEDLGAAVIEFEKVLRPHLPEELKD